MQLIKCIEQIKKLIKNHEPYVKGLIKEFIRDNVEGLDGNRKVTSQLTELPEVAIWEYLTDINRLK